MRSAREPSLQGPRVALPSAIGVVISALFAPRGRFNVTFSARADSIPPQVGRQCRGVHPPTARASRFRGAGFSRRTAADRGVAVCVPICRLCTPTRARELSRRGRMKVLGMAMC